MAQPQICDGEDGEAAIFMVQNIPQAEVFGFCLDHMLDFAQALLTQFRPGVLAKPPAKPARKSRKTAATPVADDGKDGTGDDHQAAEPSRTA